jgi:hypothetical protein
MGCLEITQTLTWKSEETQLKLDQFGSELRTEIRRARGADEKRKGCVHEEHDQYYPAVQSTL